jgi:hypothetical protein
MVKSNTRHVVELAMALGMCLSVCLVAGAFDNYQCHVASRKSPMLPRLRRHHGGSLVGPIVARIAKVAFNKCVLLQCYPDYRPLSQWT